jgi:hypothetical protein
VLAYATGGSSSNSGPLRAASAATDGYHSYCLLSVLMSGVLLRTDPEAEQHGATADALRTATLMQAVLVAQKMFALSISAGIYSAHSAAHSATEG